MQFFELSGVSPFPFVVETHTIDTSAAGDGELFCGFADTKSLTLFLVSGESEARTFGQHPSASLAYASSTLLPLLSEGSNIGFVQPFVADPATGRTTTFSTVSDLVEGSFYGITDVPALIDINATAQQSQTQVSGATCSSLRFQNQARKIPQVEALSVLPGDDDEFISADNPNAQEAHCPLGSTFQINLWAPQSDGSRLPAPANFVLQENAKFTNALGPDPLFPDNVVFPYLPQSQSAGLVLQAVHQGTQTLTITPDESDLTPISITLVVDPPASLGLTHSELDEGIISLADSTGVPPQMIKGQVEAEGRFNPFTFRYEPLNEEVGDLAISRGDDLRVQSPYANFRLPTVGDSFNPGNCNSFPDVNLGIPDTHCPGLEIGSSFSQHEMDVITGPNQDFHLRTWQRNRQTGQLILVNNQKVSRLLVTNDRYVSALDVEQASDPIFHFTHFVKRDQLNQRVAALIFTGEFPLAASYGLLQMTYVIAVAEMQWQGTNPPCDGATDPLDPTGLYDTECNLQNGGGSLGLGTKKVKRGFIKKFGVKPSLRDSSGFQRDLATAYQTYNLALREYGEHAISHSQNFLPNRSRNIFSSGRQQWIRSLFRLVIFSLWLFSTARGSAQSKISVEQVVSQGIPGDLIHTDPMDGLRSCSALYSAFSDGTPHLVAAAYTDGDFGHIRMLSVDQQTLKVNVLADVKPSQYQLSGIGCHMDIVNLRGTGTNIALAKVLRVDYQALTGQCSFTWFFGWDGSRFASLGPTSPHDGLPPDTQLCIGSQQDLDHTGALQIVSLSNGNLLLDQTAGVLNLPTYLVWQFNGTSFVQERTLVELSTFSRSEGQPAPVLTDIMPDTCYPPDCDEFELAKPFSSYTLKVINGNADGSHRVSSGHVLLNNNEVVSPSDLSQQAEFVTKPVTLLQKNTLYVSLDGKPGGTITVTVEPQY